LFLKKYFIKGIEMKKLIVASIAVLVQMQVWAHSCPLSSDEIEKKYQWTGGFLSCEYQDNGWLSYRYQLNEGEEEWVRYYSNGIPKEYHLSATNHGGGAYLSSKKYNSSGMLIYIFFMSGNYGYECRHYRGYSMKCVSLENGVDYDASVEYASQYEGN